MAQRNYIIDLIEGNAEDPKVRIVKAALEEFAMRSLSGARTREIAAKANVNHAAISYYFGGKNELYLDLARQIREVITIFSAPFFDKFAEVLKSENPADARSLVINFLSSKISSDRLPDYILRSIILIITREELYQTEIFDIFIDVFRAELEMLAHLITIASRGKIKGDKARIAAHMFIGQIHIFNSSRAGLQKVAGWEHVSNNRTADVLGLVGEMFDKFIS